MSPLQPIAWMHHGGYGIHHGFGGSGWLGHMLVSTVLHALIYGTVFRILRHLSLGEIVLLLVLVVGGVYLWNRDRRYRRF